MALDPNSVYCANVGGVSYERLPEVRFPELPAWAHVTTSLVAVRSLLFAVGLDHSRFGSPHWNPLVDVIREGAKVVIKPNWVNHDNPSGHGLDCLVTHPHVIEAVLYYVAKANPGSIV